ncbi:hypothetical protein [Microbacterium sp. UCD-TDU]|uniref:hypothetical protein n=1 Tax=Microbacterium sp. UCD-TDU TaxID=1247714 RepID=UPI000366EFF9|nr:hypothetical protein [Microbacterium sp. UCD-TDU]EYT61620.1 hypothetical protein D514_0102055 [Microbacterium sp. UCD-TDU]
MINGIHITAQFQAPKPFTDEWLEAVYTSVQRNMAVVSADMFVNEDELTISFHLGIDCRLASSDNFVEDVAEEALQKAFGDADSGVSPTAPPTMVKSQVEAFA